MDALERKSAEYVTLRLPPPISTNALHRAVKIGNRIANIKSAEYRKWVEAAGWELQGQRPGKIVGPFACYITVPRKCRIDLDNCFKALLDLLQLHKVIENDRLATELRIKRGQGDDTQVMIIATKEETVSETIQ